MAKSEGNSKGAEEPTWELFQNFSCVFKLENIIIAERLNCFRNVPVKPVPVPGSDLKPGEWMGGSMAASGDNLYVCAFLQVPDFCALFWFRLTKYETIFDWFFFQHRENWAKTKEPYRSKSGKKLFSET